MNRPEIPVTIDQLESRLLLAGLTARVDFHPAGAATFKGYVGDTGLVYGNRSKNLVFGWTSNNPTAFDSNYRGSPDQRYDTFIRLHKGKRPLRWEIAVPNGQYSVRVISGDPRVFNTTHRINAEGVRIIDGNTLKKNRFLTGKATVNVTDGKLTVMAAKGARQSVINFIEVSQIVPLVSVSAVDGSASEPGASGSFRFTRRGPTDKPLTVNFVVSGTAANGTDFNSLATSVTFPARSSAVTVEVKPKDDSTQEAAETVIVTLSSSNNYNMASKARTATVTISDNDTPTTTNRAPRAPVITEPLQENQLVFGADVHMETGPFSDPDGDRHKDTDWEIWTTGSNPQRVWAALNVSDSENRVHIHFGNGTFQGPLAGRTKLDPNTTYELRVRFRDSRNALSPISKRRFKTMPEQTSTASGWVSQQNGYKVEEIPFTFPSGEQQWRLPTNIAFVPEEIRGSHANDPLFYVTELYGNIRVVSNNFTVRTYASGVLNYNPSGPISGTGENGLTGIAVDPKNGDVYVTMLYDDPNDGQNTTYPKVTKYTSNNGGLSAVDTKGNQAGTQGTDILLMPGESMRQSHIISNITFGPDDKLYVHVGEGFEAAAARQDNRFKGKVLRINRNGTPANDNPNYNAGDGISARDYWWAKGLRNPFGGAWREAGGGRPAQHFMVENGPGLDRLSMLVRGRDYLWDGSEASMENFNIAFSPSGQFAGGVDDWKPAPAPVNIEFIQRGTFNGSGFPNGKMGHAFVTLSGPTHAQGPNFAKSIQEWVLDDDGNRVGVPQELASYEGSGYASASAIAAGPDGLYFSTLYPDTNPNPLAPGAKILRIVYTGLM